MLEGDVPSPIDPEENCRFVDRCPYATEICRKKLLNLKKLSKNHFVACHRAKEL